MLTRGSLAAVHSFLQAQPDNVIVTALKKAEDENALVVRFYEWAGKDSEVTIQLPPGAESAAESRDSRGSDSERPAPAEMPPRPDRTKSAHRRRRQTSCR